MPNHMNQPPLALSSMTFEQDGKRALKAVNAEDILERHPVSLLHSAYAGLSKSCQPQFVPTLEDVAPLIGREVLEYSLVLVPVEGDPFIDFIAQHVGRNVTGAGMDQLNIGDSFGASLVPMLAGERLMELASCLALKRFRLSIAYSARRSTLKVKVFRGVFPIWLDYAHQNAVILCIAPVLVTIPRKSADRRPAADEWPTTSIGLE